MTTDQTAPSSLAVMSSTVPGVALLLGIIKIRKYRKGHTNGIKIIPFLFYFVLLEREGKIQFNSSLLASAFIVK